MEDVLSQSICNGNEVHFGKMKIYRQLLKLDVLEWVQNHQALEHPLPSLLFGSFLPKVSCQGAIDHFYVSSTEEKQAICGGTPQYYQNKQAVHFSSLLSTEETTAFQDPF